MKNYSEGGAFGRFMAGKGFYAALAICLMGAAAAAWVTVDKTVNSVDEKENNIPIEEYSEDVYKKNSSVFVPKTVSTNEEVTVNAKAEEPVTFEQQAEETFRLFSKEVEFDFPVKGEIIKGYSNGELVKYDSIGEWRTHDGVDIAAEAGSEIKAAADGKIAKITADPLWGTTVEVEHEDGFVSIYCGLCENPPVSVGDKVSKGGVIGSLGETNLAEISEGNHLHFAIKQNGKFLDPAEKLAK